MSHFPLSFFKSNPKIKLKKNCLCSEVAAFKSKVSYSQHKKTGIKTYAKTEIS